MRVLLLALLVGCAGPVEPTWVPPPTGGGPGDAGAVQVADGGDAGDDAGPPDSGPEDAGADAGPADAGLADAGAPDAGNGCEVFGAPGQCISTSTCASLGDHTSYAGYCPGPADIECCIDTPSVADNPPLPAGWKLMQQSQVTTDMTNWAVEILHDPITYPMYSTTTRMFGTLEVLARVEWHPPDFQNGIVHRGVTLYVPV